MPDGSGKYCAKPIGAASAPRSFPVTDPEDDAPDGAIVDGYERSGDRWNRVGAASAAVGAPGLTELREVDHLLELVLIRVPPLYYDECKSPTFPDHQCGKCVTRKQLEAARALLGRLTGASHA